MELVLGMIGAMLPVIVAVLTVVGFEVVQQWIAWLDTLHATVKRLVVVAATYLLAQLAGLLGVALHAEDVTALTSSDVGALIAAALAYLFHLADKAKKR